MTGRAYVGCSGWSYRDWVGPFYPLGAPPRRWLAHYAACFDTVELNATFYRLPSAATVGRWAAAVPPGFVYAVKLGSFGSHRMKLGDATRWLPNHLDRLGRLGPAAGPTLVQLPPRWRRDTARLDEFLTVAPADRRWAVELREPSWFHDEVYAVLRAHGAALVVHDLVDHHPFVLTTDWTYVRFHGPAATVRPYRDAYGAERLRPWASRLRREVSRGHDVYAYFNNDHDAHAVTDASWLRDALARP